MGVFHLSSEADKLRRWLVRVKLNFLHSGDFYMQVCVSSEKADEGW